jgi:glycosyltransferase involved in cell wall biosynthesis
MSQRISIVIPVYNEEENIPLVHKEIGALYKLFSDLEVIYVNDGSSDNSLEKLREVARGDSRVKVVSFARNYGQTAAMGEGFRVATGDIIVPMDADLQNNPSDIPNLIEKFNEGYDVVSGWRKDRHDDFLRVFVSRLANNLIARVTGVKLNDYGCSLKAYRASMVKNIDIVGEVHRFLPAYATWHGARVAEVVVNHRPRQHGVSKYGFSRIGRVLLDLVSVKYTLSYSQKPMYFFGFLGFASMSTGFFVLLCAIFVRFYFGISLIQTPLILLAALFEMIGVQLLTMGILADVILRTRADKSASPYAIKETINI